ncbi:hypothetical protein CDL12_19451 [Handroanthus impetiginosus]|uniref:DUF679 domain-containing protein n=1 Tax=Handroanthus impetiginosus TaxID=429701 RepID=A0A2G9GRS5_9LAMI|nr:hypothetical protein CDL12_30464 [Handroanthus impetiginosus]PIN07979.1 hypothetical protein CDL12_19451 [Handroanthus impetiginosus]
MSSKTSTQTITQATLTGVGNLIKLLPTGTVFMFQFLTPLLTNNGHCHTINKYLSTILIVICSFSCCFASFTDSYIDSQGMIHYGIATAKGLWPCSSSTHDMSSYKLRIGDFVHAFFSLIVFLVVALLDPNLVQCFYPSFESTQRVLMMSLPPVIGAISGVVFVLFPNNRHGIGYPSSKSSTSPSTSA